MSRKKPRKSKVIDADQIEKIAEATDAQRKISKLTNTLRDKGIPSKTMSILSSPAGSDREDEIVRLRTTQICWALPMDEIVFQDFLVNLWRMRPMPWDEFLTVKNTYLPGARNKLHKQFVEDAQSSWLFMIDSDILPPPDFVERMLKHHLKDPRKKVLNGYYHVKGEPYNPVVYEYVMKKDPDDLPFETLGHFGEVAWYKQYTY